MWGGATGFGEVLKICFFIGLKSNLACPCNSLLLLDLIDLTLGNEDANSKVDVAIDVEVDVGASEPILASQTWDGTSN